MSGAADFSKELLEALINKTSDAVIVINSQQEIVYLNPATEKIFGWQVQELLGKPLTVLIPMQFREMHTRWVARYGETGESERDNSQPMEFLGLRKNGEVFPAEVAIGRCEVEGNRYYSAIIRDISHTKAILTELEKNQHRLELALATGKLGYWDINLATGEVFRDEQAAYWLGCKAGYSNIYTENWLGKIHQEDRRKVHHLISLVLLGQKDIFSSEFRIWIEAENQYHWVEGVGKIIQKDKAGKPLRFTGIVRSIEERKQKERIEKIFNSALAGAFAEGEQREREHIAKELHDGLAQQIQIALLCFEKLKRKFCKNEVIKEADFNQISEQLSQVIVEARNLAHGLVNSCNTENLNLAIHQLFEKLANQDKITFHLDWKVEEVHLSKEYTHNIYRIIQEVINNTLRHSEASNCWVAAKIVNNQLVLYFADDGKGFDAQNSRIQKGLGFINLQTRVRYMNGKIYIHSEVGEGCQIVIMIPIPSLQQDSEINTIDFSELLVGEIRSKIRQAQSLRAL
ncbi:MAG: PAS domain S-box protein [Bacteroidia bacterium]|nr:PAS domain S-box protein [Bacteroidia bacterium]